MIDEAREAEGEDSELESEEDVNEEGESPCCVKVVKVIVKHTLSEINF